MSDKKGKWWLLVPVVILALVLAFFYRDELIIRIAPKSVLSGAMTKLYSQLEQRFAGSPLLMLAGDLDAGGRYTAEVELEMPHDLLGDVRYDMTVHTDAVSHQIQADGIVSAEDMELDLSLYLDRDFMAVSSEDLVQGIYYGLTYDTFASDIRSIPLLKLVVSDSMLDQWDGRIKDIQSAMSRNYELPDISAISTKDIKLLLTGLMLLPGEVSSEEIIQNGEDIRCYYIRYQASGEALKDITGNTDGAVSAMFALRRNTVTDMDLTYTAGTDAISCHIAFGEDPLTQPISVQMQGIWQGENIDLDVTITTKTEEGSYWESWRVSNGEKNADVNFLWTASTGDLALSVNGGDTLRLNLAKTESGIRLLTEDVDAFMNLLTGESKPVSEGKRCIMTVSSGSAIPVPEYKNLDRWSVEDFMGLLGGVGSLIGLNLG